MDKILKKIHILGIAGAMTAPLAKELSLQGYVVSGSDQENIYPPTSDLLNGISINEPLGEIDLAIVGSSYASFKTCQDQFNQIKASGTSYISATSYLAKYLVKDKSILVAGSYGKTTISSILAWILPTTNYFFGGTSAGNFPSLHFSDSDWSIIEADESVNGLDQMAKFLYYPVKYLILTSAQWEHKDTYKTASENFEAFKKLVEKIPADGLLVYNPNDVSIIPLLPYCKAPKIPYSSFNVQTSLIGLHNQENINAALTLCQYLNIDYKNIKTYPGIKRRIEIISNNKNILIVDDFAQSATRVKSAIEALQFSYPSRPIKVFFEPHASFLQSKVSVTEYASIKDLPYEFVIGKIKYSPDKNLRVTFKDWQAALGEKAIYIPLSDELVSYYQKTLMPNDILVHFSSGGLDGLNTLKTLVSHFDAK